MNSPLLRNLPIPKFVESPATTVSDTLLINRRTDAGSKHETLEAAAVMMKLSVHVLISSAGERDAWIKLFELIYLCRLISYN